MTGAARGSEDVYLDDDFEIEFDGDEHPTELNGVAGEDALDLDDLDTEEELSMGQPKDQPNAPVRIKGGVRGDDDKAVDALPEDHVTGKERQDALLDEGVEETFPASDPVSVKHIT